MGACAVWTFVAQWIIKTILTPENIAFARQAIIAWLVKEVPNTKNKIDDEVVKIITEALEADPKAKK
jgi:hypothetical protein